MIFSLSTVTDPLDQYCTVGVARAKRNPRREEGLRGIGSTNDQVVVKPLFIDTVLHKEGFKSFG
jgi:hypothetical protein